jgi:hypothetical protein
VRLTVACGPEPAAGEVELVVPDGLVAEAGAVSAAGTPFPDRLIPDRLTSRAAARLPCRLPYRLAGGEFAAWDVTVRALPGAAAGRRFVAARIRDGLGQELEDTALVTIGEAGPPDAGLPPEELFARLQSDVQALNAEADLEVLTPDLRLAPGERGGLTVRVASRLTSPLRGELQLISPFGTWEVTRPWTQPIGIAPGGTGTASFGVTVPAAAAPGWQSWLLVKLMYFGRVRYSRAISLTARQPPPAGGRER